MGILSMIEDRPTPKAVYNWRVYFCASVTSMAAVMIGYDSAFIGGTLALPSFVDEFNWNPKEKSVSEVNFLKANVVSLYQAGAFFGAFLAYPAGHHIGRQKGLAIFSAVFILGAGMMLGATGERGELYNHSTRSSHTDYLRSWSHLRWSCSGWYWCWCCFQLDSHLHF
jgi:hypothetical protein